MANKELELRKQIAEAMPEDKVSLIKYFTDNIKLMDLYIDRISKSNIDDNIREELKTRYKHVRTHFNNRINKIKKLSDEKAKELAFIMNVNKLKKDYKELKNEE